MEYVTKPKFQFGNVVVVDGDKIGLILKTWEDKHQNYAYEVYVRSYNSIIEYTENEINHYVYSKELSEEEKAFY